MSGQSFCGLSVVRGHSSGIFTRNHVLVSHTVKRTEDDFQRGPDKDVEDREDKTVFFYAFWQMTA